MTPNDFPLLNECYAAGDLFALFPLMKDWDSKKLLALLNEVKKAEGLSDAAYGEMAVKAENFFSPANAKALDTARMDCFIMLSEIASVAYHYLGEPPTPEVEI